MGSSAPKSDPMMGIAAIMQAQTGEKWLDFAKSAYAESMERQKPIDELTLKATEAQLQSQQQANQWAAEDRDRYKSIFLPLQDEFIAKARDWDSEQRQEQVAAEAKADVLGAAALQKETQRRQMEAMGLNPASGRWAGVDRANDTAVALASAGAQNNARNALRKEAVALQGEAINLGSGLPTQAASALGLGVQSGTNAVSNRVAAEAPRQSAIGQMYQGYQGAMQGYAGMGNTLAQKSQIDQNAYKLNQAGISSIAGGLGTLAGMLPWDKIFSDEEQKENKKPAKGILEAVKEMPVEEWQYKDDSPAADGGKRHIGTYAQDFKEATGLGDGKTINVIDAIGVTMGAVKELAQKVDKLESKTKPARKTRAKGIMREAA